MKRRPGLVPLVLFLACFSSIAQAQEKTAAGGFDAIVEQIMKLDGGCLKAQ